MTKTEEELNQEFKFKCCVCGKIKNLNFLFQEYHLIEPKTKIEYHKQQKFLGIAKKQQYHLGVCCLKCEKILKKYINCHPCGCGG